MTTYWTREEREALRSRLEKGKPTDWHNTLGPYAETDTLPVSVAKLRRILATVEALKKELTIQIEYHTGHCAKSKRSTWCQEADGRARSILAALEGKP